MVTKLPGAQFSEIWSHFSTWNFGVQERVIPVGLELLHYVAPIKAVAQLYSSWCSYKNFRHSENRHWSTLHSTCRASRKSSQSTRYMLCCCCHTYEYAL